MKKITLILTLIPVLLMALCLTSCEGGYQVDYMVDGKVYQTSFVPEGKVPEPPPTDPELPGYIFDGWDYDFSVVASADMQIMSKWIPKNDTPYRIEYYLRDKKTGDFVLSETENLEGTTGETVSATPKKILGYRFAPSIKNNVVEGQINGDGSFAIKLYYVERPDTETIDNYKYSYDALDQKTLLGLVDTTVASCVIENDVVAIANGAFSDCTNLASITIPPSVRSIGDHAFSGCINLNQIKLSDGLESIGDTAFNYCPKLTSVSIPKTVTSIGYAVFNRCDALASLTVDEENTTYKSIDNNIYTKDGKKLIQYMASSQNTSFALPDSVEVIGQNAFFGAKNLNSITLGNNLKTIEKAAFKSCENLQSITIPDSVTEIGEEAFRACFYLKEIVFGSGIKQISDYAFYDCLSIKQLNIPGNVEKIGNYAFYKCFFSITVGPIAPTQKLIIGEGVVSIGDYAFAECNYVQKAELPDTLTTIGEYAFSNCRQLELQIGTGVSYIGKMALPRRVVVKEGNPYYKTVDEILYTGDGKTLLSCLNYSDNKNIVVPEGVEIISDSAFCNMYVIQSVTLPSTLKKIGHNAFGDCENLKEINLPEGLEEIGERAFYYCSLESVTIPSSLSKIEKEAFRSNENLKTLIIPDGVTIIGESAFSGCRSLHSVKIPASVVQIDAYAFCDCIALKTIELPAGLKVLKQYVLHGSGIQTLVIPDSVETVESFSITNCPDLVSITIGSGVKTFNMYFGQSTKLLEVINKSGIVIKDRDYGLQPSVLAIHSGESKIKNIDGYLFYSSSRVENYEVVEENVLVGYIGDETELVLPENYNGGKYIIGASVFKDNRKITSITIPESVIEIRENAFSGCNLLAKVIFIQPLGWEIAGSGIAGEELENQETAANYLKNLYANSIWENK